MKSKRLFKLLTLVVSLVILTVLILVIINRYCTKPHQTVAPEASPVVVKKPAPKMIRLPGAKPIQPIEGDYKLDNHIWKLVNKQVPLTDLKYRPTDLALATVPSRTDKSTDERSVRLAIMPDLERLFAGAKAAGHDLMIGSGFRSYDLQNMYYSSYSRTYGVAQADKFSAKPGQSEHQLGLVVDLAYQSRQCYLDNCFADTLAGQWLANHAHEYGFILRYPSGKEVITGYMYESWHFRYLGVELATALFKSGLTLEEAQDFINNPT